MTYCHSVQYFCSFAIANGVMPSMYEHITWFLIAWVVLYSAAVGEYVRNQARTEPPPYFGDPEIDAAVQFARLVGVQSGFSWGAFYRDSVAQQERQFVEAMRRLIAFRATNLTVS